MRNAFVMCAVVLALAVAAPASAGGFNLAWNDCFGAGGAVNKNFACNSNDGSNDLYVSFEPPLAVPDVNGANAIIDVQSDGATLPPWWQFKNAGSCRLAALSGITVITGTCPDMWQGGGVPGIAAYLVNAILPSIPPNRARILGTVSYPFLNSLPVATGTEYFVLLVRIANTNTVGPSCPGCQVPACLVLNEVLITTNNSGDFRVTNPLSNYAVFWQGGAIGGGCFTPTLNRTWGQVKSIYR